MAVRIKKKIKQKRRITVTSFILQTKNILKIRLGANLPSQKAVAKAIIGMFKANLNMYMKKKGSQHAMNEPMISPKIRVALFSFCLAIRLFSRSGSFGLFTRGTTYSINTFSLVGDFGNGFSSPPPP